jgi:hypothetical protein
MIGTRRRRAFVFNRSSTILILLHNHPRQVRVRNTLTSIPVAATLWLLRGDTPTIVRSIPPPRIFYLARELLPSCRLDKLQVRHRVHRLL